MPGTPPGTWSAGGGGSALARYADLILPLGIVASVLVIMVPLPAALLDVLLAGNISLAVIVLLTTIYVRTPLQFGVFPTLLLATTLGRLVLNVATTRLILTRAGSEGLEAAGGVVRSFGEFVAGDKLVVGFIIFAIIVVIQFVVITKGATRISEVAARFALDGMPGRQMAIDADLGTGVIDQREAQRRRREVAEQADFFGAMDGAGKFVRGDAIAGVVITLINIVGGLLIGVFDDGMSLGAAVGVFTKLTIGDGLVTQVPALLISLAAGLLVTRSSSEVDLPIEFLRQLFSRPQALAVTGGFLGVLLLTDLPTLPLAALGAGCVGCAIALARRQEAEGAAAKATSAAAEKPVERRIEDYLAVDPLEIEIGVGLIRLADPQRGGDLLARVQQVRQAIAAELGIVMPKVRIRDNLRLEANAYRIKLADTPLAEGRLQSNVADPNGVLTAHLAELVRRHADEILSRDATKHLLDELKKVAPAVVDELVPSQLKLAEVQHILRLLLREGVAIRQLSTILEALGDHAGRTKDPLLLTEAVRRRLARTISSRHRDAQRRLHVVTLSEAIDDVVRAGVEQTDRGLEIRISPAAVERVCRSIGREVEGLDAAGHPPVVLVSPQIRAALREITAPRLPQLHVLSFDEITGDTQVEIVGQARDAEEQGESGKQEMAAERRYAGAGV